MKTMKEFKVKNMEDLNEFFKSNEKSKFRYKCDRNDDDYTLRIEAYSLHAGHLDAMYNVEHVESYTNINIHIDSRKFMEEYNSLPESEQLPKQFEILNPCLHEYYMRLFVEVVKTDKLLALFGDFNGDKNDYYGIAKLAGKSYGAVFARYNDIL